MQIFETLVSYTLKILTMNILFEWMQKAKRTVLARKHASKTMKAFFSDPINRQNRSIAMKGRFHLFPLES